MMMLTILRFLNYLFLFQFSYFHHMKNNIIPETNHVNYVLISMDDIGLYQTRYTPQVFNIWATIIRSAHRQNITVVSYLVENHDNMPVIKMRLEH